MIRLDKSLGSLSSHRESKRKQLSNIPLSNPIEEDENKLMESPTKRVIQEERESSENTLDSN